MTYVFIDTNIFLHFIHFEQINWANVINKQDDITIVLASTVVEELDKHKYNSNKKIAKRVKKLLPQVEALIEGSQSIKYPLLYISKKPSDETLVNFNFQKGEQDDLILAAIIEFAAGHNLEDIAFVTNDVGPRLKAKTNGIAAFKIPDQYLLPTEPDEAEKEAIELRKELLILKNRLPILKIVFNDGAELLSVKRRTNMLSQEAFVEKQMEEIKNEYHKLYYYPPGEYRNNRLLGVMANSLVALSQEQVERYNEELDKFFVEYEVYARSLYKLYVVKYNSIEVKLVLQNAGTAPAKDIDVHLHFPDGFELVETGKLPKVQRKPEPPYKPQHRFDLSFSIASSLINPVLPNYQRASAVGEPNASKPMIRKTNSYDVDFHVKNVKHHQQVELSVLYVRFEDINAATGFGFDYKLVASDLPNIVNGKLSVKFEKE